MPPESPKPTVTIRPETWEELEQSVMDCRFCPRLVQWREEMARKKRRAYLEWEYWGRPVPGFGDSNARLLVVGLAPAAHGANRTGRMFTGDSSGDFLYQALYRAGFSNQPVSHHRGDGLELRDILISASVRCAPPDNKPTREEIKTCRSFLIAELNLLSELEGIVALGKIAFDNVLETYRQLGHSLQRLAFAHGAFYPLGPGLPWLLASYHPSRQNTQTGRLTGEMFDRIWRMARQLLENGGESFPLIT